MKSIFSKYYGLIPLLMLLSFVGYQSISFPIHDFANYYFGGKFLVEGHFTSLCYFPFEFNKAIADAGYSGIFVSYAPNTPFLALIFAPFSVLPIAISKIIFNSLSIFAFLYSIQKLSSFYQIKPIYLLLIPIIFFIPIRNEILFGQIYFLLFFFLSESWMAYQKNQLKTSACYLAIAILLKIFPALLLLIPLFKNQFKYLLYIAGFGFVFLGISVCFSGFEIWQYFLTTVLSKASNGEISEAYVSNYQSMLMFLKELLIYEPTLNRTTFYNSPAIFLALLLLFKSTLLVFGFFITKKATDFFLALSYWILVMLLISPYGSTYTLILLLFPYFGLIQSDCSKRKKIGGVILIFLANNLPTTIFLKYPFPFSYLRLFVLLLLLTLILYYCHKHINYTITAILLVTLSVLSITFAKRETSYSKYFLQKESPILIYDFQVKGQRLTYCYWNENGENTVAIPFEHFNEKPLQLKENQIYYNGIRLISDSGHKKKPLLVDGKFILYLSDYDRGIGFYTIRKVMLNTADDE